MPDKISTVLVEGVEYEIADETARTIIEAQQTKINELEQALPTFVLEGTTLTITTSSGF